MRSGWVSISQNRVRERHGNQNKHEPIETETLTPSLRKQTEPLRNRTYRSRRRAQAADPTIAKTTTSSVRASDRAALVNIGRTLSRPSVFCAGRRRCAGPSRHTTTIQHTKNPQGHESRVIFWAPIRSRMIHHIGTSTCLSPNF